MKKSHLSSTWVAKMKWFVKSKWLFPSIVLLGLCTLTALNLNGSSIGVYHSFLYGSSPDANLVAGMPQPIRSDEWLVNTQMTIIQREDGYPYINHDFAQDKNMSLVIDAPYKEWSALFKPQNFSFFVLPFENAFAFKWWFLLSILLISSYFFCLKLLPGKIWIAVLGAITISFSPFVFWWYQTSTAATIAYGFLIMTISMNIIDNNPITLFKRKLGMVWSKILRISILTYLLTSFALILYPPYQIPVAIVVFFFVLGYLIHSARNKAKFRLWSIASSFAIVIAFTGALCGTYLLTRSDVVSTIENTAYPGKRIVTSGGYDINHLLVSYLQPQLERTIQGKNYYKNQSESSNFILLPTFFILPAIALLAYLYKMNKKLEWTLLMIIACNLLFFAQMFLPGVDFITKFFALQIVPLDRLVIGMGVATFVLIIYSLATMDANKFAPSKKVSISLIVYSIVMFGIMVWAGFTTSSEYPSFISNKLLIMFLAGVVAFGSTCLGLNKPKIGLSIIALFSVASVITIHPLYRGLGVIYNGEVSKVSQNISPKNSVWAAAQNIYLENIPLMSQRKSLTGIAAYPSNDFWNKEVGPSENFIYNRYAHTFLSTNDSAPLVLVGSDLFAISAGCERKVEQKIDYIISTTTLDDSCRQLIKTLQLPGVTLYFYKRS